MTDAPGLRERKRLATRRAIQVAAITLVRDRGLESVTVDDIARQADVSPRTFFNYFTSKEEAIVGGGIELPGEAAQQAFVDDDGPVFPALARMFEGTIEAVLHDHEVLLLRRSLMKSDPELGARRWASLHRFEVQVLELIERRLAEREPGLEPDERRARARLTAFVAVAAIRHAWISWMDDNGEHAGLLQRLGESFDELTGLIAASARA